MSITVSNWGEDLNHSPQSLLLSDDDEHNANSNASKLSTHPNKGRDGGNGQERYNTDDEGNNERSEVEPSSNVDECGVDEGDDGYEAGDEDEWLREILVYAHRTSKICESSYTHSRITKA